LLKRKSWLLGTISGERTDRLRMQYGPTVLSVPVSGVEPSFWEMRNLIPDVGGRFINEIDMEQRRRVVFLGTDLAEQVFGDTPPVGETVQLHGSPFLVVGVLKEKSQNSNYGGPDTNRCFIPGPAFRALTGQEYVDNIVFNAADVTRTEELTEEIRTILAARHRYDPADEEAMSFWDTTMGAQFLETFMISFRLFLGILGCLTLVVGGIGVSNIMNVVVEERTREIGVKMAIGAKPRTILGMFLMETLAMTAVGGALGLGFTVGICAVFPLLGMDAYVGAPGVSPAMALATVGILGLIGFISGYFPARTAANLDPVVAMKR
jgi:putative ABC transport system permease protein